MQIIRCEQCGKRYKIRGNNSGQPTSYRCNACFNIISVLAVGESPSTVDVAKSEPSPSKEISVDTHHDPNPGEIYMEDRSDRSKNRYLSIRTKFNLAIAAVLACAIVVIYLWSENRLRKDAENQVFDKARLILTTMEASRDFTSKVIKPSLYEAIPDRFITEAMSSSFGARNIFNRISKVYPQYYFKHAAPYPRNPVNQADSFEMQIIAKFNNDRSLKEWQGYRTNDGEKQYSIMKPIEAKQRCMRCHGEPTNAPPELLKKYGTEKGFGRSVGEVIGTLTISVPASVVMKKAGTNTLIFVGMVVLFFILTIIVANIFFSRVVVRPIKNLAENADEISLGKLGTQIDTSGGDEISILAKAFERMRISVRMAFDQLSK